MLAHQHNLYKYDLQIRIQMPNNENFNQNMFQLEVRHCKNDSTD